MTDRTTLKRLKTLAKRYGRANRLPHHTALNLVAEKLGFPHWKALISAAQNGRQPTKDMDTVEAFVAVSVPDVGRAIPHSGDLQLAFDGEAEVTTGEINGHQYQLEEALDYVHLSGKGWHIQIGEAPSAEPRIEVTDRRYKSNPLHDPEFVAEAIVIAKARIEKVRARISLDWPRRSTMPDAQGCVRHPLFDGRGLSAKW